MLGAWDNPHRIDAGINWYPRRDAGLFARCVDCLSNLREPDSQFCSPCGFKIDRRRAA